jgi:DNA-binding SARP family transcriptional activator
LRGYVLRLRRLLGGGPRGPLTTRAGGYDLVIEDDDLDARVFERLVTAGRRALAEGDLDAAEARLSRALGVGCRNSDVVGGLRVRSTQVGTVTLLHPVAEAAPSCCQDSPT